MTTPSTARSRRARIRRTSAAVLLASGLTVSATAVASAAAPSRVGRAARRPSNVVGLKKGAYGDAVKALQEALVRVGIGVKYGVDSYFGSATEASVKAFQRYKGLPDHRRRRPGDGGRPRSRCGAAAAAAAPPRRQRHARPRRDRAAGASSCSRR